jgi:predicted nucleic acid-binding protein
VDPKVVDVSAIIDYLSGFDDGFLGSTLRNRKLQLHIPVVCDLEVTAGLRKLLLKDLMTEKRARDSLDDYLGLPLWRHDHYRFLRTTWYLRHNFSAYDAAYVALALVLGATILTTDGRLRRAVEQFHSGLVDAL